MANVDYAFGLQVWGPLRRARLYAVQTAPTIAFYHGDPVQHGGSTLSTQMGQLIMVEDGDVVATGDALLGAVIGVYDEHMDPVAYIAAAEAGDTTVAGYLMIADDPDQLFLIQEDGDTTPIPAGSAEMNVDLEPPSGNAGWANGVSKCELDSDTVATTASLNMKLHHPHPDDTPGSAYCRWVVSINCHQYGPAGRVGKVSNS